MAAKTQWARLGINRHQQAFLHPLAQFRFRQSRRLGKLLQGDFVMLMQPEIFGVCNFHGSSPIEMRPRVEARMLTQDSEEFFLFFAH